ncbi:MAG: hypothetical protein NZ908_00960 [Candidatus Micrarchaeota archaeon]|nr:hypothetical protein [Candidatus Micrarchaeota archaeon]MCX8154292.1 hypothetical protein [Candidatus Micrarchaeota archaeon]
MKIDPRQLANMIRSMGGKVETITSPRVVIQRDDRYISLVNAQITKIVLQNQTSYMIVCEREELEPKDDELDLICSMKGVSREEAYALFKKANGDLSKILGD